MRETMSAVSEQVSVGTGRIKEKSECDYIRALRRVADGADIVLLVLDAGPRQLVGEKVRGCKAKRLYDPDEADIRATDPEAEAADAGGS
ncbi:hypothetical protein EDB84DRAFT_1567641 [Lactarius hengduanensis]|nr:hypothetical protein EDB84DRAFT_1567641 [Lactarius hengduanensis]